MIVRETRMVFGKPVTADWYVPDPSPSCEQRGYHVCLCHGMNLTTAAMVEFGAWGCALCDWQHPDRTPEMRTITAAAALQTTAAESRSLANHENDAL